jgi:hypothetical protein
MSTTYVKADQIALQTDTQVLSYEALDYSDALRKDQIQQSISDLYNGFVDGTLNANMDTMKEIYEHYSAADDNTVSTYRLSVASEITYMDIQYESLSQTNFNLDKNLTNEQTTLRTTFNTDQTNHELEYDELSQDYFDKTKGILAFFNTVEDVHSDMSENYQSRYIDPYSTNFYNENNRLSDETVRLTNEQSVVKTSMEEFSTHTVLQLDGMDSFLNSRYTTLNTELNTHSTNVLNTHSTDRYDLETMVNKVTTSEIELSDVIEDIVQGTTGLTGVDGAAKYSAISTDFILRKAEDDVLYNQLQTAINSYTNTTNSLTSSMWYTHDIKISRETNLTSIRLSADLINIISDAKLDETDLSTDVFNMNKNIEGLDSKLITYNTAVDITNDNLVAAKNICIGNHWRFKTDATSLSIQYNPTPTDSSSWQTVPFLKHSNTANAEALLVSNTTTMVVAKANKPTIAMTEVLAKSIINNGTEDRSVLRGVVHQLLHNVEHNLLVVGSNAASIISYLQASSTNTFDIELSDGTSLASGVGYNRIQSSGLLFADLSTALANAVDVTSSFVIKANGTSATLYYFPFVMDAGFIN